MILLQYQSNGFKTLVSNDYDQIIEQIIEYFIDAIIKLESFEPKEVHSKGLKEM